MGQQVIDMASQRFGRLFIIERAPNHEQTNKVMWLCKCDCGNIVNVLGTSLRRKRGTQSCGCLVSETSRELQWKGGQFNEGSIAWANKRLNSIRQVSKKNGYMAPPVNAQEYLDWSNSQEKICFICGKDTNLHVDHCHLTGNLRGILCSGCNYGLGCFKDDPNLLQMAISYLK